MSCLFDSYIIIAEAYVRVYEVTVYKVMHLAQPPPPPPRLPVPAVSLQPVLGAEAVLEGGKAGRRTRHGRQPIEQAARELVGVLAGCTKVSRRVSRLHAS